MPSSLSFSFFFLLVSLYLHTLLSLQEHFWLQPYSTFITLCSRSTRFSFHFSTEIHLKSVVVSVYLWMRKEEKNVSQASYFIPSPLLPKNFSYFISIHSCSRKMCKWLIEWNEVKKLKSCLCANKNDDDGTYFYFNCYYVDGDDQ